MIFRLTGKQIWRNLDYQKPTTSLTSLASCYSFAKLSKSLDKDLQSFENVQQYYQDLIRFSKSSDRGILSLEESNFKSMLQLLKSREDIEITTQAYYNFIGHRVPLSQTIQDTFVKKAVELESADLVMDLFRYHNYLMYFPSPSTTKMMLDQFVKTNNAEQIKDFIRYLEQNALIKINDSIFESVFEAGSDQIQPFHFVTIFRLYNKRNMTMPMEYLSEIAVAYSKLWKQEEHKEIFEKKIFKYSTIIPNYISSQKMTGVEVKLINAICKIVEGDLAGALHQFEEISMEKQGEGLNSVSGQKLLNQFVELFKQEIANGKQNYAAKCAVAFENVAKVHKDSKIISEAINEWKGTQQTSDQSNQEQQSQSEEQDNQETKKE